MAKYGVAHNMSSAAPEVHTLLTGGGSTRVKLGDIVVGSNASPADQASELRVIRTTVAGAGGTALAEENLDPLTAAPVAVATGGAFTTNPTTSGADLLRVPLNQRATFRWVAAPGSELISAAVAANGLAWDLVAQTALYETDVSLIWEE